MLRNKFKENERRQEGWRIMGVEGGAEKETGAKSCVALQVIRCLDFPDNNGMSVGCGCVKTYKI